ncbi:MAG TPA: hypothetical protein VGE04_01360 [Chloroflexia bacterium]|jgi:hypothetical protein
MTAPRRYFPTHPAVDFAQSGIREPDVVHRLEFVVPPPGFKEAWLRLSGVKVSPPVSYSGDVYITPIDVEFTPRDRTFRQTYFVDLISMLGSSPPRGSGEGDRGPPNGGRAEDPAGVPLVVDLTGQLVSLAQEHEGEVWVITVALVAIMRPNQKAPDDASLANLINFDTMELEIR